MNSLEELRNKIELLKQALLFYGNEENYEPDSDMIDKDKGSQARFALKQLEDLDEMNEEMGEEYIKLLQKEAEKTQTPEGIIKLIKEIKNAGDGKI